MATLRVTVLQRTKARTTRDSQAHLMCANAPTAERRCVTLTSYRACNFLANAHGRTVFRRCKDVHISQRAMPLKEMSMQINPTFPAQSEATMLLAELAGRAEGVDDSALPSALAEGSALQTAIFNSVMFSKIATDAAGVIQLFNVGAEHMLGYTAAEVVNRITPAQMSDPGEVVLRAGTLSREFGLPIAPGFEALAFKASRGIEDIYELTYIRKDGSRFPAVVSVTALRDGQDRIIGYLLIGSDNTARQQAQQALRDSEARLNFALEMSHTGGWSLDLDSMQAHRTLEHDRIFGYNSLQDSWTYDMFLQHVVPEDRTEVDRLFSNAVANRAEWRFDCRILRRDGEVRWIWGTGAHQQIGQSQAFRMSGIVQDITTRKLAESALRQTNIDLEHARIAAEKANEAKSDFLSSMSHELRSPLNAILGFAQLIELGPPALTASQKESTDQILLAGWYLLALINEILDLSLIESGNLSLSPEAMALGDVLIDCHAMIEPQARISGITLNFPEDDCPVFVKADRTRVKQVLVNLLSNAIKYNRPRGEVLVGCHEMPGGRVRVSVADTGDGLSEANLANLFQPFNRLGQETGKKEGTGIGLVVSKRLVELMGGSIGVESQVGHGSTFWIELAAASADGLSEGNSDDVAFVKPPLPSGSPVRRVLCIEDNPANLLLIEKLLNRRSDISLITASTGERGIEMAHEMMPDIILMDINLPGISGLRALKILAENPLTAFTPVIALSANAMARDIEKGIEAGFFRYLTKPIRVEQFMATLDDAFLTLRDRRSSHPPS